MDPAVDCPAAPQAPSSRLITACPTRPRRSPRTTQHQEAPDLTILYSIGLGLINALVVGILVRRMMFIGTGAARNTVVSLIMGLSIWPITLQAYKLLGISEQGSYPNLGMGFPSVMVFLLLFAWFIVIQ